MLEPAIVITVLFLLVAGVIGYRAGLRRILLWQSETAVPLPSYFGAYVACLTVIPALLLLLLGSFFLHDVAWSLTGNSLPADQVTSVAYLIANGEQPGELAGDVEVVARRYIAARQQAVVGLTLISTLVAIFGFAIAYRRVTPRLKARQLVDRFSVWLLRGAALLSIIITLGIVGSVLVEALRFFRLVDPLAFLFGINWSPQNAVADPDESFGVLPLLLGTGMITLIAMLVATPLGLYSAIYMAEYAKPAFRRTAKPVLEILAGIPTVVYGYFAINTISPLLRALGVELGITISAESALTAGLVMGVMIVPFISSLSDDILTAVPQSLRDASYGLGATQSETIKQVVLPAALPGIMGAVLLAISRAVGETMIVVMAAGLAANVTANPLESVTTVTAQIVALLTGDQEFDSAKTLAAFALGLTLFVLTLLLNIAALLIVKRYREQYD